MLSNTLRLTFLLLRNYLHSSLNKCVCIYEIIGLIMMKMKMKKKNKSHRYEINKLRFRHGHKYCKHMKCLSMMMLTCINQHLRNI